MLTSDVSRWRKALLVASLFALPVFAKGPTSSIEATFSGELIEIPCKFANTTDLDFDFKDIIAQEIDDKAHFVDQTVSVTCDANSPSQLLTLRIAGTPLAGADKNVVDSGLPDMGIALTNAASGNALNLNEPLGKDATDVSDETMSFTMRATPVNNKPGTTLTTGDFSAGLTLSAKFE